MASMLHPGQYFLGVVECLDQVEDHPYREDLADITSIIVSSSSSVHICKACCHQGIITRLMMRSNQPKLEGKILRTVIQHKPNYQDFSHDLLHSLLLTRAQ